MRRYNLIYILLIKSPAHKALALTLPGDINVWKYLFNVTQIPRGSNQGEEFFRHKKILAYLENCAKELGHDVYIDKADNIIVRMKATPGFEDKPSICLQCHMDMVCQKDDHVDINMETDPLVPRLVDNKYIMATGTSLGADDGAGIAVCFGLLENKEFKHGPLEVLVTRDEETGLYGAAGLEEGVLKSKYLINVDSEEQNAVCVGCAGGFVMKLGIPVEHEGLENSILKKISIKNFVGGHSGCDINLGRANPLHIMARLLKKCDQEKFRLVDYTCGSVHNAIPRRCDAVIAIEKAAEEKIISDLEREFAHVKHEYTRIENDIAIEAVDCVCEKKPFTLESTQKTIDFLNVFPFGPQKMNFDVAGLVETSITCAIAKVEKEDEVTLTASVRSSSASQLDYMYKKIGSLCTLAGVTLSEQIGAYVFIFYLLFIILLLLLLLFNIYYSTIYIYYIYAYPGWEPDVSNVLTQTLINSYREVTKVDPKVYAIHAGLECGLFQSKYPDMKCTSIGPDLNFPHSPNERLLVSSVDPLYKVLIHTLEQFTQ
ncbi:hypothetical protein WA158_000292 [Blastocystis sp. Blastoise]